MDTNQITRNIKKFIHRHETLETTALVCFGILTIARTFFIFRKLKTTRHISPSSQPYKVIFLTVRSFPLPGLIHFEAVFFHAFSLLGIQAKMLFHDGMLNSTDAATYYRGEKPQKLVSTTLGGLLKSSLAIDAVSYKNFLTKKDVGEIKQTVAKLQLEKLETHHYEGIAVGLHAKASTIRYFLMGQIDITNERHVKVFREKLVFAIIAVEVARRLVAQEKPSLLFTLHGVYSTWGPFYDYFRQQGIDTLVYNLSALRFGYFTFNRNSSQNEIVSKKAWEEFSKSPLSKKEKHAVNRYFETRLKNKTNDQTIFKAYFNTRIKKDDLLQKLLKNNYKKRYVLYPNLAWDEVLAGGVSSSFKDIFEWIDTTIPFFQEKKGYQLIVKPHPAERIWEKGTIGISSYIHGKYKSLPENIVVLPPDVPLTAYDLITPNMIGLTFCGTLGLELAALGVPILAVAEKMHYSEAGIVYQIKTSKEYLALLENPSAVIVFTQRNLEKTKKYAYFYYFKSMTRIPFYRDDIWSTLDWRALSKKEEIFSKDSPVIQICKKLVRGEDIVAPL